MWRLVCVLWMSVVAGQALASEKDPVWSVARDAELTVYSQAGGASARGLLDWLVRLRSFFAKQPGFEAAAPVPLRAVVFRSSRDYEAYRVQHSADAYYASYGSEQFIVMPPLGAKLEEISAHEYTHAVLHLQTKATLPPWLDEGLAEVFSTVALSDRRAVLGAPREPHAALLRGPHIHLQELLTAPSSEFQTSGRTLAGLRYAESWALLHLLLFSPDYRVPPRKLIELLETGQSGAHLLERVTGRTIREIELDLRRWLEQTPRTAVAYEG